MAGSGEEERLPRTRHYISTERDGGRVGMEDGLGCVHLEGSVAWPGMRGEAQDEVIDGD